MNHLRIIQFADKAIKFNIASPEILEAHAPAALSVGVSVQNRFHSVKSYKIKKELDLGVLYE